MEVIAVYRESEIKTYGFDLIADAKLFEASLSSSDLLALGQWLRTYGTILEKAALVVIQKKDSGRMIFSVCLKSDDGAFLVKTLNERKHCVWKPELNQTAEVDLLYFHGPHFGDRYGIADAALKVLERGTIPILLGACSMSSIYLAAPKGAGKGAVELLKKKFVTPGRKQD